MEPLSYEQLVALGWTDAEIDARQSAESDELHDGSIEPLPRKPDPVTPDVATRRRQERR